MPLLRILRTLVNGAGIAGAGVCGGTVACIANPWASWYLLRRRPRSRSSPIVTPETFAAASKRAEERRARGPTAVAARYDPQLGRVVVSLSTGLDVSFRPQDAQGLEAAKPDDLAMIEVSPSGQGLHFPALDADLFVPALLEGLLRSKAWMAARASMPKPGSRPATPRARPRAPTAVVPAGRARLG